MYRTLMMMNEGNERFAECRCLLLLFFMPREPKRGCVLLYGAFAFCGCIRIQYKHATKHPKTNAKP